MLKFSASKFCRVLLGTSIALSSASAAPGAGSASSVFSDLGSFLPMMLVLGLAMYFMVIRPQNRRQQEQQRLIDQVKVGDEVMTIGGMVAKVTKIAGQYLTLQAAKNSEMVFQKSAVAKVLPKGTLGQFKLNG